MGLACAALGWPPAAFWAATAHELLAAFEAHREINKVDG